MNVKGAIVLPPREIKFADGSKVKAGRLPALIVYPKSCSGRHYREFLRWCGLNGVALQPIAGELRADGRYDAFEALAPISAPLAELIEQDFVADWHYIFAVGTPRGGSGQGEHSERSRKACRIIPRPDRLANEAREAIAQLPADVRESFWHRADCVGAELAEAEAAPQFGPERAPAPERAEMHAAIPALREWAEWASVNALVEARRAALAEASREEWLSGARRWAFVETEQSELDAYGFPIPEPLPLDPKAAW